MSRNARDFNQGEGELRFPDLRMVRPVTLKLRADEMAAKMDRPALQATDSASLDEHTAAIFAAMFKELRLLRQMK